MIPDKLKNKIEIKRLNDFITLLPATSLAGFIIVAIICFGLVGAIPAQYLWLWVGIVFFTSLLACLLTLYFKKNEGRVKIQLEVWQVSTVLLCAMSGLSWGIASSVFYGVFLSDYQAYIVVALVIVLSSYFPVLVHNANCFSVFALGLMSPVIFELVTDEHLITDYMAAALIGYLCLMLGFARWSNSRECERIRLQLELYEQNDRVKEANDSKSRFLASASHDLRQPLQALGFYLVMLSDFLREPNKKALFDKTLKAYQALEGLLNQLLNISKLNADLVDIVKTDFSVAELFEKLKNDYQLRAMEQGLSIQFTTDDYYAHSDVVSVERILRNLLENALRYTNKGYIKASCQMEQDQIVFKVADSGIGIAQSHVDKIFGEFYQVKNPERDRSKGFGLGLYAVDRLAKLLDTSINVESEVGKGSVFSIAIPIGERPQGQQAIKSDTLVGDRVLRDKTIMLVDDDEVVLDSISRFFYSWGSQVLLAGSWEEAMDLIVVEELIPELMIVDYRLPNHKTGVSLVKNIRKTTEQSIPAIILTGDTGEESLTDINQSGLAFMHKPADPLKLKKRVKNLLVTGD